MTIPANNTVSSNGTFRTIAVFSVLFFLTIVVYLPALDCGFIWDDDLYVEYNETLHSVDGLIRIWLEFGATQDYYPLTFTTFWLEYQAWGLEPRGYHLDNVLLHALNVVVIFFLLRRLHVPGAFFAAAIFAVHPVHVESVAWVTERKNVLSGFFGCASVWAFVHARRLDKGGLNECQTASSISWRFYFLSVGIFVLSMLSKTVTITLPFILPVLIWWKTGRLRWWDLALTLPYFAVAAPFVLLSFVGDANFGGAGVDILNQRNEMSILDTNGVGGRWDLTFVDRLLLIGRVIWFYVGKLVWPVNLSFIYPRWTINNGALWPYLIALITVFVPIIFWHFRDRLGRGPLAAVLFYGLTLAPASGIFNFYFQRYSFVADHFQYLASLGIITLISAGILRLTDRALHKFGIVAIIPILVVLATLSVLTIFQQSAYVSRKALWIDTLVKNPTAIMARVNLSYILIEEGNTDDAISLLYEGLQHSTQQNELAGLHTRLGEIHTALGQQELAIEHFKSSLEFEPGSIIPTLAMGELLFRRKNVQGALRCYQEVLKKLPTDSELAWHLREIIDHLQRSRSKTGDRLDVSLPKSDNAHTMSREVE